VKITKKAIGDLASIEKYDIMSINDEHDFCEIISNMTRGMV